GTAARAPARAARGRRYRLASRSARACEQLHAAHVHRGRAAPAVSTRHRRTRRLARDRRRCVGAQPCRGSRALHWHRNRHRRSVGALRTRTRSASEPRYRSIRTIDARAERLEELPRAAPVHRRLRSVELDCAGPAARGQRAKRTQGRLSNEEIAMSAVETGLIAAERSERTFRELSPFGEAGRQRINAAGRALLEHGALSTTRSFNAGIRVSGEEKFVLGGFTPSGEELATAAIVGFDGTDHEGKVKKAHLELLEGYATIFRERSDVHAAIHTHSPYIEGFAFAHRELPILFGDELRRLTREPIPLVPWEPRYSAGTIRNAVRNAPNAPAVIIAN